MEAEPKNDQLWGFIARCAYSGLITYAVLVLLAFHRDLLRKSRSFARVTRASARFSPLRWHSYYIEHYRDTNFFYYVEILRLLCNGAVCVLYVFGTYHRNVPRFVTVVYRVLVTFFIADILSVLWDADSALASVTSLAVWSEAFSIPSMILAEGESHYLNFTFLRSVQTYIAFDRLQRRMFVHLFSSKRLICKLFLQCLTLFYTLAAGIQLLEIPGDLLTPDFRDRWAAFDDWNFFNAIYFVIVTLSTVGYGDFSPSTIQGRLFTILMIIVGIVIFSSVIGELVEQSTRGPGSGWFMKNPDSRHVIVTGTPTLADLTFFVSEFYSDFRDVNADAKLVVLVEKPSWTDTEWYQRLARNQFLQARVQYLVGSVRNSMDLQRARINGADAVFFLNSPSTGDSPSTQDTSTVMNILAVRNARTDIPVYALTLMEESNSQTDVALKTPTTYDKATYFRNTKIMRKGASYNGLFHEILQHEYEDLPTVHNRDGRTKFEQVLKYHEDLQGQDVIMDECPPCSDLERSQLVCLQEMHMALMAGNMRVNGLSTLLANMYLEVQVDKPSEDDPVWISEYQMGATCSLAYAIMPNHLDSVQIRDVALEMYHVGLILVATTTSKHLEFVPVLGTNATLRRGDIGMFLTYHEPRHVVAALHLVAERHRSGDLRHPLPPSVSRDDMPVARSESNSDAEMGGASTPSKDEVGPPPGNAPPFRFRMSGSDYFGGVDAPNQNNGKKSDATVAFEIPEKLSGHVIVAIEGEMPISNLALFLEGLWRQDDRRSVKKARKSEVVVMHPNATDIDRDRFSQYEGSSLFFVEGDLTSGEAWHKAKLSTAKAVATMADYTGDWHISDARAIFTLLTLEVSTVSDHDLFICSELVDERSLEFLREPMHPRRRGAMLGERVISSVANPIPNGTPSSLPPERDHPMGPVPQGPVRDASRAGKSVSFQDLDQEIPAAKSGDLVSLGAHDQGGSSELPPHHTREGLSSRTKSAPGRLRNHSKAIRSTLNKVRSSGNSAKGSTDSLGMDFALGVVEANVLVPDSSNPTEAAGAARARRGSLFSRSRYASGELLIHSSAITLLAREYNEPGFARLYSNLIGTESYSPGLKIRLVRIPKLMFSEEHGAVKRNDQFLVPYSNIFRSLIRQGVTPLGIYRSGQAPALIPRKPRVRRGEALVTELEPYLEKDGENGLSIPKVNGLFGSLWSLFRELQPSSMQEARGRYEVTGGRPMDVNSEESSEEETDDRTGSNEKTSSKNRRIIKGKIKMKSRRMLNNDGQAVQNGEDQGPEDNSGGRPPVSPRMSELFSRLLGNEDEAYEVLGQPKYRERQILQNMLPYVYTLPDPNTLCAERDGIYVLCDPCYDLSSRWIEDLGDIRETDQRSSSKLDR